MAAAADGGDDDAVVEIRTVYNHYSSLSSGWTYNSCCCCITSYSSRHSRRTSSSSTRLDSVGYNWVLCITRQPLRLNRKSPQPPRDSLISLEATTEHVPPCWPRVCDQTIRGKPHFPPQDSILIVRSSSGSSIAAACAGDSSRAKTTRISPALADTIRTRSYWNLTPTRPSDTCAPPTPRPHVSISFRHHQVCDPTIRE